jgi:hypothetical protein
VLVSFVCILRLFCFTFISHFHKTDFNICPLFLFVVFYGVLCCAVLSLVRSLAHSLARWLAGWLVVSFSSDCVDYLDYLEQLMPITPASELRDDGSWLAEMLPRMTDSCFNDACTLRYVYPVLIPCISPCPSGFLLLFVVSGVCFPHCNIVLLISYSSYSG